MVKGNVGVNVLSKGQVMPRQGNGDYPGLVSV